MQAMFLLHKIMVGGIPLIYASYQYGWIFRHYAIDVVLMTIIGSMVSTLGTILIDTPVRKLGLLKYRSYKTYVKAANADPKIDRLNCERILYRDMIVMFLLMTMVAASTLHLYVMCGFTALSLFRIIRFHKLIVERIDVINT